MTTHSFILLASCLIIVNHLSGQEVTRRSHFGISVMPQISHMDPEDHANVDNNGAFSFSIQGDFFIDISSRLQFNTGLEWQHTGWNYKDQTGQWPSDVVNGEFVPGHGGNYFLLQFNEEYIGLPLLIRFKIGSEKPNHFYLQTGIKIRRLISTSGGYQLYEGHQPTIQHEIEESVFFVPVDWNTSWNVGVGYEWAINKRKLFVNPVWEYSLGKMYEELGASAIANGHRSILGLRVGIR